MPRVVSLEFTHTPDCVPAVIQQSRVVREIVHGSRKNPNCSSDGLTPATTSLDCGWHGSLWGGHDNCCIWASSSFRRKARKTKILDLQCFEKEKGKQNFALYLDVWKMSRKISSNILEWVFRNPKNRNNCCTQTLNRRIQDGHVAQQNKDWL